MDQESDTDLIREEIDSSTIYRTGQGRIRCPLCSDERSKQNQTDMSVTESDDVWLVYCHHCGHKGAVKIEEEEEDLEEYIENIPAPSKESIMGGPLNDGQMKFMEHRGISAKAIEECGVVSKRVYIKQRNPPAEVNCIGFPYRNADGSEAVKWRDDRKNFTQTGAARSLWRIEEFKGGDLIITEGELDALSFAEAGVFATSVPNGASRNFVKDDKNSKKFSYLWDAKGVIDRADRIIIAGDQDGEAGPVLIEELARRIGKARCWRMSYPIDCKDANDVLKKYGAQRLRECLTEATPWPIGGLRDSDEYREDALSIWRDGLSKGVDISVGKIQEFYRPSPGTLTVCTGVPSSGKTTFLNWLSFMLAKQEGWNIAVFSAETSSQVHLLQLASLKAGKPFFGDNKMSEPELNTALDWISGKFVFLDESETSINSIIERAQAAVLRNGVRVLMVDPFNFISTEAPKEGETEQRGVRDVLVALKNFATEHDVAVWLVAHPKKMYRDSDGDTPIPTGYDISGSAHFFNVCDSGITLSRINSQPGVSKLTSWKARFQWLGSVGNCELGFNIDDGSYFTKPEWGSNPDVDFDLGD